MTTAARYPSHFLVKLHTLGHIYVLLFTVAQLPVLSKTESVCISSRINKSTVFFTASKVDHFALSCRGENLLRLSDLDRIRVQAKLPIRVVSKAIQFAVFVQSECKIGAAFYAHNIFQPLNLLWQRQVSVIHASTLAILLVFVTQLTLTGSTPRIQRTIFGDCCCVCRTTSH